jgi:DNA-binding PadR family transcriptional regulator
MLLRRKLSHIWEARLQQIYSELAKLEADGLVKARRSILRNCPAKKVYSLTPAGGAALDAWLDDPSPRPVLKDSFFVRLYCLERTAPTTLARQIEQRGEQYERQANELRQHLAQTARGDRSTLGQALALEASLAHAEALASWCARTLAWLEAGAQHGDVAEPRPAARRRGWRARA